MKKLIVILLFVFTLTACNNNDDSPAIETPQNIRFEEDTLHWDPVQSGDIYLITLDDVTYWSEKNAFDMSAFPEGSYVATVATIIDDEASAPSDTYHFTIVRNHDDIHLEVSTSIHSADDAYIHLQSPPVITGIALAGEPIDLESIYKGDDYYAVARGFLDTLAPGEHTLEIETVKNDVFITIAINENVKPFLASASSIAYENDDIVVYFELLGGSLRSLSGQEITQDDYTSTGNRLSINQAFFDAILEENPNHETIILSYQLEIDGDIVIGYLFIQVGA